MIKASCDKIRITVRIDFEGADVDAVFGQAGLFDHNVKGAETPNANSVNWCLTQILTNHKQYPELDRLSTLGAEPMGTNDYMMGCALIDLDIDPDEYTSTIPRELSIILETFMKKYVSFMSDGQELQKETIMIRAFTS